MRKVFFCVILIPFFFAAATAQGRQEFRIDDKYIIALEPGETARYNNQPMTFSVEGGGNICWKDKDGKCLQAYTGIGRAVRVTLASASGEDLPKKIFLREKVTTIAAVGWPTRPSFEALIPFTRQQNKSLAIMTDVQMSGYDTQLLLKDAQIECDCELSMKEKQRIQFTALMQFIFGWSEFRQELWLVDKAKERHVATLVWRHTGQGVGLAAVANNNGQIVALK